MNYTEILKESVENETKNTTKLIGGGAALAGLSALFLKRRGAIKASASAGAKAQKNKLLKALGISAVAAPIVAEGAGRLLARRDINKAFGWMREAGASKADIKSFSDIAVSAFKAHGGPIRGMRHIKNRGRYGVSQYL